MNQIISDYWLISLREKTMFPFVEGFAKDQLASIATFDDK